MAFTNYKNLLLTLNTTQISDTDMCSVMLDKQIRSYGSTSKLIGHAFTVESNGNYHAVIDAFNKANEDDVLIIDNKNSTFAIAGELFATEAKRKKLAGIIIDGYCRDIEGVYATGIPFFAKGVTPKIANGNAKWKLQKKITCGGVLVNPKDIIFADQNGIVVIDPQNIQIILHEAKLILDKENEIKEQINSGVPLSELIT